MIVIRSFFLAMIEVLDIVLGLYIWLLVIGAVLSWLTAFDIVNHRNRFVQIVGEFIYRITEPALKPIRRFIPILGGIDLSPLVLIFAVLFIRSFLHHLVASI